MKHKKAQEEIVGFALIMIIVAVILLIFLGFYLSGSQRDTVESYEVESFIQSILQYTTDCEDHLEYIPIQKLIADCVDDETCLDGRRACDALNSTLKNILKESWKIEGDRPLKGYEFTIFAEGEEMLIIKEGNSTNNYKGSDQFLAKKIEVFFTAYY
ncbi:hypothetical protein KAJ87_04345 [Candidatus Pacearchaeota archaeon]|nr:hypothetical protein [Candidatus Pacearchaeota archaeon]